MIDVSSAVTDVFAVIGAVGLVGMAGLLVHSVLSLFPRLASLIGVSPSSGSMSPAQRRAMFARLAAESSTEGVGAGGVGDDGPGFVDSVSDPMVISDDDIARADRAERDDFIVAVDVGQLRDVGSAWDATYVRQAGSWFDASSGDRQRTYSSFVASGMSHAEAMASVESIDSKMAAVRSERSGS